jgi:phage recombination protein Bet
MSGLITQLGSQLSTRLGLSASDEMLDTLKRTAFKSSTQVTESQFAALLIVANQYGLNPWTREIYAFPDKGGIVPVVGVDGWARIMNEHPQMDGMDFVQTDTECTCIIYRKDRAHPVKVTEYLSECKRDNAQPWKTHPKRMLRHKAMIQAARLAFGFTGIFDQDEAERIVNHVSNQPAASMDEDTQPYIDQFYPQLAHAAKQGVDALSAAFAALPKSAGKAALWKAHSTELKATATAADITRTVDVVAKPVNDIAETAAPAEADDFLSSYEAAEE